MKTEEWYNYQNNQEDVDACIQACRDMCIDVRTMPLFRHCQLKAWEAYKKYRRVAA
jgi:hypothetical protein